MITFQRQHHTEPDRVLVKVCGMSLYGYHPATQV